jgi:hypothetical protein
MMKANYQKFRPKNPMPMVVESGPHLAILFFNLAIGINEKRPASLQAFLSFGDSAGIRTQDPILKRDVLYQLSY